jgi:hypothetical protein
MEKDVHMKREYIDNLNVKCLSMIKAWKPDKISDQWGKRNV